MEVLINVLKVKERMLGETARKLMVVEIDKTDVVQLHMVEVVVYEMFVAHDLELTLHVGIPEKTQIPDQRKCIIKSATRNCLPLKTDFISVYINKIPLMAVRLCQKNV